MRVLRVLNRAMLRMVVLVVPLVILNSCSLQNTLYSWGDRAANSYVEPHGTCTDCHVSKNPQAGDAIFSQNLEPSRICLNCHNYSINHHPNTFTPAAGRNIPFPLVDGELKCVTCHVIHAVPNKTANSKLLRNGPYKERREICVKCHVLDEDAKFNPHNMIDEEGIIKKLNGKQVCLKWHSEKPNPINDRTDNVKFRADIGFLCMRCHPPMPQAFFKKHFLEKPSENTLAYMHNTEIMKEIILPIIPRGRLTCSTCHNPHQKGIMIDKAAAKGADENHRLRLADICSACHPYQGY